MFEYFLWIFKVKMRQTIDFSIMSLKNSTTTHLQHSSHYNWTFVWVLLRCSHVDRWSKPQFVWTMKISISIGTDEVKTQLTLPVTTRSIASYETNIILLIVLNDIFYMFSLFQIDLLYSYVRQYFELMHSVPIFVLFDLLYSVSLFLILYTIVFTQLVNET
jgi:hypothetical protein